jgi:hypothetical protein
MRVELGFDNSLCLVDIERLELRTTGFTEADYGNVLRYDPEVTFWHEHRLSGSIASRIATGIIAFTKLGRLRKVKRRSFRGYCITTSEWREEGLRDSRRPHSPEVLLALRQTAAL